MIKKGKETPVLGHKTGIGPLTPARVRPTFPLHARPNSRCVSAFGDCQAGPLFSHTYAPMTDGPASSSAVPHRALLFSLPLSLIRGPLHSASPSTRTSIRIAHAFLWLVDPPLSAFSSSLARDKIHGRAIHGNKSPYPPRGFRVSGTRDKLTLGRL
jgi:hypothetical protein